MVIKLLLKDQRYKLWEKSRLTKHIIYHNIFTDMDLNPKIDSEIRQNYENRDQSLSPIATKNSSFIRRKKLKREQTLRLPFSRDSDRILHSKAYARYIDKTQVFFLVDNDHITHRVLHVQLVSKISRTIGRALGLNEDLLEAISLGHDIGHPPYGHMGETILRDLCNEYKIGNFFHNVQAIQFLDAIENLDLTLQVLDGILCHNGEVTDNALSPDGDLTGDNFDNKVTQIQSDTDIKPSTYEGCVVRLADNIAYLGRDLEDAIELDLLTHEDFKDFPESCKTLFNIDFNNSKHINWTILDTLIKDVINTSYNNKTLSFSKNAYESVLQFKQFNYDHIYHNEQLHEQDNKIIFMFQALFEYFTQDYENKNKSSLIYKHMLDCDWISSTYKETVTSPELVRDFIAGMTDRYFEARFFEVAMPIRRENFS
jgi:dGTPase